ncbi:3988_t:CDS:2 [Ambispora leptoticha]|uniref:3988_t:CDS:1 n=1 Tax=Ambispora leptoticha TaxID=144679 RepID=A0A9N9A539_9GLOM|nr:3988_t:CDS:2 [Ambispora leptoticha]
MSNNQICTRSGCGNSCYVGPNNYIHPFCGRTCAIVDSLLKSQVNTCANPGCTRPCYVELNGTQYSFCGKTCARIAASISPALPKCANCNKTVYVDFRGQKYPFCGVTCASLHNNSGPNCIRFGCNRKAYLDPADRTKSHSFCSKECFWMDGSTLNQTKMTILYPNQIDYEKAYKRFNQNLPNSTIKAIFRLQMPKLMVDKHLALKNEMARTAGSADRITHRMFHGTKTSCDPLRLITSLTPSCTSNCGVCGILREGNRGAHSRQGGGRMWFAKNSSVSLGYCDGKPVKTMFMVDVLSQTTGDILIVSKDEETLPRFLLLFQ